MTKQKKILLLGGSMAQLIAIKKAKSLGYITIVCDYLRDNPGQFLADYFYLASTTDKEAILDIAKKEEIDGIVAYGSDPAAPTAAYVAQALNLPGLNFELAQIFCEKHLFRKFLQSHNFNVPKSLEFHSPLDINLIKKDIASLNFPIIVKPTDSSGSKGVTVINDIIELPSALEYALKYSRNNIIIIESFIQRDHPFVIEAEIFTINGKIVSWGLINTIRDNNSNPLLPAAYTFPLELSENRKNIVRENLERLISICGKVSGAFNIEMIIDKSDNLYFLDGGPRNGGNMLPEFISMISGKDIVEATLRTAMGELDNIDVTFDGTSADYWGLGVLHSYQEGKFSKICYSELAQKSLIREEISKNTGEKISPFRICNDFVGYSFFRFDNLEDMNNTMCNMQDTMKVNIE